MRALLASSLAGRPTRASFRTGTLTVCTQCAARRGIGEDDLREGVRIAGAALFAEQVLGDGVQALVY